LDYELTYKKRPSPSHPEPSSTRKIWDEPPAGLVRAYIADKKRKREGGFAVRVAWICADKKGKRSRSEKTIHITAKSAKDFRLRRLVTE